MPAEALGKLFEPRSGQLRIERQSWKILQTCRTKLNLAELPLPIPVEEWIETGLGIRFGVTDLSHLGEQVLGAAYVRDREILVDQKVLAHEGRFRFTCAHELGHLVLHKKAREVFRETAEPGLNSSNRYERQADRFAASFLLPIPLLEAELFRICRQQRLDAQHCLSELMLPTLESEWLWRRMFLPALTAIFGVSVSAALIRFGDLRLASADHRAFLPSRLQAALLKAATPDLAAAGMRLIDGRPARMTGR